MDSLFFKFSDKVLLTPMIAAQIKFGLFLITQHSSEVYVEDFYDALGKKVDFDSLAKIKETNFDFFNVTFIKDVDGRGIFNVCILDNTYIVNMPKRVGRKAIVTKESEMDKDIKEIFAFWELTMKPKRKIKLTDARYQAIKTIMIGKNKKTKDECFDAIIGCSKSLHHMGFNMKTGDENQKKYNDIINIFRKSNIDRLIANKEAISIEEQLESLKMNNNGTLSTKQNEDVLDNWENNFLSNLGVGVNE